MIEIEVFFFEGSGVPSRELKRAALVGESSEPVGP